MKEAFDLEFCYKGSRDYVHGTDIFTKLLLIPNNDLKKIDIAFHDITINNMTFTTNKPINNQVNVTFRALDNQKPIKFYGVENNKTISCRYPYEEDKIVKNSTVDPKTESIILNTPTEYSFIEHIVAMNKALLEELYRNKKGKWYFTRLQLHKNIDMAKIQSLKLVLNANFQFKLTKTVIIVDGENIGYIYFSLIQKED